MINTIMEAISLALDAEFGENYSIYVEEVPQDLQTPCFFITCINAADSLYPSHRYKRQNQFAIQYFPVTDMAKRRECLDTAERMLMCLEQVTALDGTSFLKSDTHFEITDGALHFFVNYNFFTRKRKEYDRMESLQQSFRQKG